MGVGLSACDAPEQTPGPIVTSNRLDGSNEAAVSPRADGFVYTIDVGLRLEAAAIRGDRASWLALRSLAERVVRNDDADPWTRGMVAWRWKDGTMPDASGTTEALRIASGLWRGAESFSQPDARTLALTVLDGYATHAREDRDIWFIANYFNFGTRALATNSFVVDYDPDLLMAVLQSPVDGSARFSDIAARSCSLVRSAHTRSGLAYDIVQPEVTTLTPDGPAVFSPNDIVQINNAATVAERAIHCDPALANSVLTFVRGREDDLRVAYLGRTGDVASAVEAGPDTWAVLARLALRSGDHDSARRYAAKVGNPTDVYARGEVALTDAYLAGFHPMSR